MAVSPGKADRRQSMPDISPVRRDSGLMHHDPQFKKKSILSSIVSFFTPKQKSKGYHLDEKFIDEQAPKQPNVTQSRRMSTTHVLPTFPNNVDDPYIPGFTERYSWGNKIGAGAFSTVKEVYFRNAADSEDRIRAAKIVRISVRAIEEDEEEQEVRERQRALIQQGKMTGKLPPRRQSAMTPTEIEEEINLLKLVQHNNIVKLHEVIQHNDWYYIIMDKYLCDVEAAKPQEWSFARLSFVCAQICLSLFHLHSLDVCHRDLKPQNIFLKNIPNWRYPLAVISDFGLATRSSEEFAGLSATSGSLFYLAPEVLQRKYGRRADMWSFGVCIYWMLYGCMPFTGKDDSSLAKAIQIGNVRFPSLEEESSPAARKMANCAVDFLKQILVSNPKKRLSSYSALKHPFIRSSLPDLPWAYETIRAGKERIAQNDVLFKRAVCAEMGITSVNGVLKTKESHDNRKS